MRAFELCETTETGEVGVGDGPGVNARIIDGDIACRSVSGSS